MRSHKVLEGNPELRGALWIPERNGTHFAVYSPCATSAWVALFDSPSMHYRPRELPLPTKGENGVWSGFVEGIKPNQLYCFRVEARNDEGHDIGWHPTHGKRINHEAYVKDPYAWAIGRLPLWRKGPDSDLERPTGCNKDQVGLASVIDTKHFYWEKDTRPYTSWDRTIIMETHVRDLTMRHPFIPDEIRGTYAALCHPVIIEYIKSVGATALQIQPLMAFPAIGGHWGYMTVGFMAPHPYYSQYQNPLRQCLELKEAISKLHEAGIEVILDFVPNHSGEGGCNQPAMTFRGLANETTYRLHGESHEPARHYADYTGCGNTLNCEHPETRAYVIRVLRHWATFYQVDGFRFDLAGAIFLTHGKFDCEHPLFQEIAADPILNKLKWVAEPWDANGNTYTDRFPDPWKVTDGSWRDDMRCFIKAGAGDLGLLPKVTSHLAGKRGRLAMLTCHDGLTLADLWKFNHKHNDDNQEESGEDRNHSWNCGHEGETDNSKIKELRRRMYRFSMSLLYLNAGPKLIYCGDPILHSRDGNNNPWAQDNELSHLNWDFLQEEVDENDHRTKYDKKFLAFCQGLAKLRKENSQFRYWRFNKSHLRHWFTWDGAWMNDGHWHDPERRAIGVLLESSALETSMRNGQDRDLIILVNAHYHERKFILPSEAQSKTWTCILDTHRANAFSLTHDIHRRYTLKGRSLAVLKASH